MKPIFFALTAIGALAAAAPAVAQSNYGYGYQGNNDRYYSNYNSRGTASYDDDYTDSNLSLGSGIARLEARLNAGIRAGTIDSSEAMRLRSELRDLRRMDRRYSYGGVNSSERTDLMARLRSVREDLRAAEGGSGYGYNEGYRGSYSGTTGNGAYGNTYSNGYGSTGYGNGYSSGYGNSGSTSYSNGYGNGYSNAYPSTSNGYYGRGGPEEEVDAYGSLRVGDAVTGSLYGVPYALRNTYRDGYNYYYRSDGRAIYQIDSRSNTVMRVYPVTR